MLKEGVHEKRVELTDIALHIFLVSYALIRNQRSSGIQIGPKLMVDCIVTTVACLKFEFWVESLRRVFTLKQ